MIWLGVHRHVRHGCVVEGKRPKRGPKKATSFSSKAPQQESKHQQTPMASALKPDYKVEYAKSNKSSVCILYLYLLSVSSFN